MRKWLVFAIVLVLALVSTGAYFYWENPKIKTESVLPRELNEDFDSTVNVPMFLVKGIGNNNNSLRLEYATPQPQKGKQIESVLKCEVGIKVRDPGKTAFRDAEIDETLSIVENVQTPTLFHGLCEDKRCSRIIGECYIYLN